MIIPNQFTGITGNIPAIRDKIDEIFITGVSLPVKFVKDVLNLLYKIHGLNTNKKVPKKARATDLETMWELKIKYSFHKNRLTGKMVRFVTIL